MVAMGFVAPVFVFIGGTSVVKRGGGVLRWRCFKVRVKW